MLQGSQETEIKETLFSILLFYTKKGALLLFIKMINNHISILNEVFK